MGLNPIIQRAERILEGRYQSGGRDMLEARGQLYSLKVKPRAFSITTKVLEDK